MFYSSKSTFKITKLLPLNIEFYQQFLQLLKQQPVVLATVIQVRGSTPREVGAKMLIFEESTFGTIGGGAGEAKVIQQAQIVLKTGKKQFVEIDLSGASHRDIQGICGGWMQVWLEKWEDKTVIQNILNLLQSGQSATLVTPFIQSQNPYFSSSPISLPNAFIEVIQPPPTLLIIGAGHIAVPLAKIAKVAGFQIIVQDDRPKFATVERFPIGTKLLSKLVASSIQISQLYIALVTRGYQYDLDALDLILRFPFTYPPHYIGMVGSKKRVQIVFQSLQQQGISPNLLKQIYAPIGLEIGALTPEEIAISICAELIQVRRKGRSV